jgi:signal transduction histidine kinase
MREVCDIVAPTAHKNGNELLCSLEEVILSMSWGPHATQAGAGHLAGNAVKFTSGGEVSISVEVSRMSQGTAAVADGEILFRVSDTARYSPGTSPSCSSLLNRAATPQNAMADRLGLNICFRLVSLMGGTSACPVKSAGIVFWFTLELTWETRLSRSASCAR